jgi:hypothetical protein
VLLLGLLLLGSFYSRCVANLSFAFLLFIACQGFTNSLVFTGHLLDIPVLKVLQKDAQELQGYDFYPVFDP